MVLSHGIAGCLHRVGAAHRTSSLRFGLDRPASWRGARRLERTGSSEAGLDPKAAPRPDGWGLPVRENVPATGEIQPSETGSANLLKDCTGCCNGTAMLHRKIGQLRSRESNQVLMGCDRRSEFPKIKEHLWCRRQQAMIGLARDV